nr:unnamed protein product [Callosobruchus chinensis]
MCDILTTIVCLNASISFEMSDIVVLSLTCHIKEVKMKLWVISLFLCSVALVNCGQYTTKYDNIDLDRILSNERLLKNYMNCLMDRGRCTKDAAELKQILPDALATDCSKCNEKQKRGAKKVAEFLTRNKPNAWKELVEKYDRDGKYRRTHSEDLKKFGIIF